LREAKAGSTTEELTQSVRFGQRRTGHLDRRSASLWNKTSAANLAELRILNEAPAGDSDLRRNALEVEKELRTYRAAAAESEEFLKSC